MKCMPSGTYCLNEHAYNPAVSSNVSICQRRSPEGAACLITGGTSGALQCELGFSCVSGFCRRACSSNAQCPCAQTCGTIDNQDVCAMCWSSTGMDNFGRTLDCWVNAHCCNGSTCVSQLLGTPATPAGTCCRPMNATCDANSPCCFGLTCNGSGVCTVGCGSSGAQCTMGSSACTNLLTSTAHCGACNNACTMPAHATGVDCIGGLCLATGCSSGFANCDGDLSNGCEVNIGTSTAHCGGCGLTCSNPGGGASCINGACVRTCTGSGRTQCGTECVDLTNNAAHCGACGRQCVDPATCVSGSCTGLQCYPPPTGGVAFPGVVCPSDGSGPRCCRWLCNGTWVTQGCRAHTLTDGTMVQACGPVTFTMMGQCPP